MLADPAVDWASASETRLRIGRALLSAVHRPQTAAELARAVGKDQSNIKKEVDEMVRAGLLVASLPLRDDPRPGRPPAKAYDLANRHVEALRLALDRRGIGSLRRGQELVYAAANAEDLEDLCIILSESKDAAQAAWTGLCGGDAQEFLLVFDGPDPVTPAVGLATSLGAAKISCRRATLTQLKPTHQLLEQAWQTAREARRTRIAKDTRHVS